MKVKVRVVETITRDIVVDVDSTEMYEIKAELDYMSCEGKLDPNKFDSMTEEITVLGIVEPEEGDEE